MQSLQVFSNGTLSVRTHVCNEVAYFNAKDVAAALDYKNPRESVRDHVFPEDRFKLQDLMGSVTLPSLSHQEKTSVYITEPGVWTLICGSQKEEARVFKRWLCSEVLPSLRKYYQQQMCAPLSLRNESDLHHKVVQAIRRFWPHALLVAGLGELQDTPEKRIGAWRCGYMAGQPDILLLNAHKSHNGFALELKNPKGTGKLSEKQVSVLEKYRSAGFLAVCSDEYDVILLQLFRYMQDSRLKCELCGHKFKNEQTLHRHCSKFHKCC